MDPSEAYVVKKVEKVEGENYPHVSKDTEKPKYIRATLSNGNKDFFLTMFEGDAQNMCRRMAKCLVGDGLF